MKIENGLLDHMVLQRNSKNVSEALFNGTTELKGEITATVRKGRNILKGFKDVAIGRARNGRFRAELSGLPVGGPYDIELKVRGKLARRVKDVLVGDVWILGGQSNMQGCGMISMPLKPHSMVRAFYMSDSWLPANDPIHNMWDCVDQVHIDINGGTRPIRPAGKWGACPGPSFGQHMHKLTGIPQGMLACSHGGTSLDQWSPKLKKLGGKSLYGAMMRRIAKNGSKVAGMLWYQGESDTQPQFAPTYTKRMKQFVAAVRKDCKNKRLPFVLVQIARVIAQPQALTPVWNSVQEQQRRLPERIGCCSVVPAIDLDLDDLIHISGRGHIRLGARLAGAMHALTGGRKAGLPPIALGKVSIAVPLENADVIVEFKNVVGKLRAGSRPAGFAIVTANGPSNLYDIELKGKSAIIHSTLAKDMVGSGALYYGYGTDPYCNITDEADRSLPVFGPARIGRIRAMTPLIHSIRVSAFQPMAGDYKDLKCPTDMESLHFVKREFPIEFCSMRDEIVKRGTEELVFYYACKIECEEDMKLVASLGYDGPVKAWIDGTEIFFDPEGTNPALPTDAAIPFDVAKGAHELIVGLGTHGGMAWGIFLRFERMDLSQHVLGKGPAHYKMPLILG